MPGATRSNMPTKAQRAAQSLRDKRLAKLGNGNGDGLAGGTRRMNGNSGSATKVNDTLTLPAAIGNVSGAMRPRFDMVKQQNGDLRIRVRHREFIADVVGVGATTFGNTQFSINPGIARTFPWLSQLARLFESYKVNALAFEYRTSVASSSAGKVFMSVDWDAADPAPTDKVSMLQERTKADIVVWANARMVCDRADLAKFPQRYVRGGTLAANLDVKTYDVGNMNMATLASAATVGELFVEYDIELITPNPFGAPLSAKIVGGGTVADTALFGTAPVTTGSLSVSPATNTITFNTGGQFLVELEKTGTVLIATVNTGTATSVDAATFQVNAAGTNSVESWVVTASAGQTLILNPVGDTTTTASVTRIAQYEAALV